MTAKPSGVGRRSAASRGWGGCGWGIGGWWERANDGIDDVVDDVDEQRVAVERLPVVETHATEAPGSVAVQRHDPQSRR
jgi:hypothetical protein